MIFLYTKQTLPAMKISRVLFVLLKEKPKPKYDITKMKAIFNGTSLIIGLFTGGVILSFHLYEKGYRNILTLPARIYMKSIETDLVTESSVLKSNQEISQEIQQFKTSVNSQKEK